MPLKKLDDVKTGETIQEDLTNSQGAVLVRGGTVLGEKHLRLLRMWGIETVKIAGGATESEGGAPDEALLDQAEAQIKEHFGASLDNEIMAEILRVAVERRAARMLLKGESA